ncbi:MAG: glutamine-hydrolyzing carbamoyl-phosphate synthase small subunit [Candidatus Marsarchaeota archaeon]|nr:glutamine-hydrolyzing carbamoyl-phosphate synthase small subunit [Candidatus Marsarchaeota archaeon]
MEKRAYLYTGDGILLEGKGFGSSKIASGELVFSTAMNGYPESLTDPSYFGQILVLTNPLIGNYGVPNEISSHGILQNFESEKIMVAGLVISDLNDAPKWNKRLSLDAWLKENGIPGIYGIDTRALTLLIRNKGAINGGILQSRNASKQRSEDYEKNNIVKAVSTAKPIIYKNKAGNGKTAAVIDLGLKHGLLSEIFSKGYSICRLPYDSKADEVLSYKPSCIIYSNGPGNPNVITKTISTFTELSETGIPMLGICLGHQVAVLANGGSMQKMKFGHRAINKPVIDLVSKRAYITTHNHGYAAYLNEIPKGFKPWFISPDDGVLEGMVSNDGNVMTVQFHPEAKPGTHDTSFIFDIFFKKVGKHARR